MRQEFRQTIYLLAAIFVCLSCNSNSKVPSSKPDLQFFGPKSKLSTAVFENLGYQVKIFGEGPADEWHKVQFQTAWSRGYQVKSRTSLREQLNTFPRYSVTEEVYETEDLAAKRIKRIQEKPPDLPFDVQEYWMVTGFQSGKNVYFIQTDSVVFDYYMKDFTDKLRQAITN